MIIFLRALFLVVIASMLGVTTWASLHTPIFAIPRGVVHGTLTTSPDFKAMAIKLPPQRAGDTQKVP